MNKVKITVYISSHNYGRYLKDAVESVLRQTIDGWELFLIDDNSKDKTKDIMELYRGDKRIKLLKTSGIGLPRVANLALKHSKGNYIMRLDADDVLDENILLVLSNYLNRHEDIAFVFPDYFLVDEHGEIIRYEGRQSVYNKNHLLDLPANGACTMIRKSILKGLGGYREDLGAQDGFDLWTRALKKHKCANVNIPLFYYRRHGENLTENKTMILSARRSIKKDACAVNLDKFRPINAVIPCRRHYDIYPDLWNKKLGGKTLLDITVETCLASKIFDKIIVTSDNPDVRKKISGYGHKRLMFIERSRESTICSRSIVYTLEQINKKLKIEQKGLTIVSYIHTPFIKTETLEEAVYTLIMNNTDSAFAVEEMDSPLYRRTQYGLMPINPKDKLKSDFDVVYKELRTSLATKNTNVKNGSLTGSKISYFVIPKEEAFFIDSKTEYEIAKILNRNRLK